MKPFLTLVLLFLALFGFSVGESSAQCGGEATACAGRIAGGGFRLGGRLRSVWAGRVHRGLARARVSAGDCGGVQEATCGGVGYARVRQVTRYRGPVSVNVAPMATGDCPNCPANAVIQPEPVQQQAVPADVVPLGQLYPRTYSVIRVPQMVCVGGQCFVQ